MQSQVKRSCSASESLTALSHASAICLEIYWWCIGDALTMCWCRVGNMSVMFRWRACDASVMCWRCVGDVMGIFWRSPPLLDVLTMRWRCSADVLLMFWQCSGNILVMFRWCFGYGWSMFWDALVNWWCFRTGIANYQPTPNKIKSPLPEFGRAGILHPMIRACCP